MTRYIFITGGVVSSLGKGLLSASLGALLQARGYSVRLRKLDPYLNVDPGTMSPYQHGEVFVTDDGAETDLDLGHYERFTGVASRQSDNITSGRIYQQIIQKERRGDFLGGTVQVIPHVTDAIKEFVLGDPDGIDFMLCEIGGTAGDIEAMPFMEAIRQLSIDLGRGRSIFAHLTLVPYLAAAGELKTKPTQHSVRDLRSIGIQPDILICRSEHPLPDSDRRKISLYCNVAESAVIPALDAKTIYEVPISYHKQGLDVEVLKAFDLAHSKSPDLGVWEDIVDRIKNPEGEVTIAVVGKYTGLPDAYKSLNEAISHGGISNKVKVHIEWIESEIFEGDDAMQRLEGVNAILVPGGFGKRGTEGKIAAAKFAREHKIPFFGICLGMQMATIEAARNLAGFNDAGSTECREHNNPVVGLITEWVRTDGSVEQRSSDTDLGGTMRLGSYPAVLKEGSRVAEIYGATEIQERHRHRYEVNIGYMEKLEASGVSFSGMSPDGELPEIMEISDHPWFIGVQFHPELKSKPFAPHPLFASFVEAAIKQSRLV